MFPQVPAAGTNNIVRGMAGLDPDTQGIKVGPLMNKDLIEKVKFDLWQLVWGCFTFFGNIAIGLIEIIVMIKFVRWFPDVTVNGKLGTRNMEATESPTFKPYNIVPLWKKI